MYSGQTAGVDQQVLFSSPPMLSSMLLGKLHAHSCLCYQAVMLWYGTVQYGGTIVIWKVNTKTDTPCMVCGPAALAGAWLRSKIFEIIATL